MNSQTLKILLCLLLFAVSGFSVSAEGIMELFKKPEPEEVPTLQEIFDEMPDTIPAIAITKPEIDGGVDLYAARDIINSLISVFIKQGIYRPHSINNWLDDAYPGNEDNISELIKRVAKEEFEVETVMTSSFRMIDGQILLRLGFYHLKYPDTPVYFMRYFRNMSEWEGLLPGLLKEMELRVNDSSLPLTSSSVYIKNFPAELLLYSALSSGEFEYTKISILKLGNQDFRADEDVIKDLLTYEFYSMKLVNVVADDMMEYRKDNGKSPCQYIVDGKLRISEKAQMLFFKVYKQNSSGKSSLILENEVPIEGITIASIQDSLRYITKFVNNEIMSDKDLDKVSYNSFNLSRWGDVLFYNNCYIGNPSQVNFCLPIGFNYFSVLPYDKKGLWNPGNIDKPNAAVFVSPLDGLAKIYESDEAKHLEFLEKTGSE